MIVFFKRESLERQKGKRKISEDENKGSYKGKLKMKGFRGRGKGTAKDE